LNHEYLSAAAEPSVEPSVELAERGGSRIKVKSPAGYNFFENYYVGSGGWKKVASIEIIESRF